MVNWPDPVTGISAGNFVPLDFASMLSSNSVQ
jgi:hypothetical protein